MRIHRLIVLLAAFVLGAASIAQAQVDSAGGFNHSIPIELPSAVGGVQPRIELSYNSHAGNGLLGTGWELEGFPVITRMNFGAGINYNAHDTYVGPGGRLIAFNGAGVYHTEDESWVKYVPYRCDGGVWTGSEGDSGPCMWRATEPDGTVFEYGGTEDSRIQAVGRAGAMRVWALSKVTDTADNFYTVRYDEDTVGGDYRPSSVAYNQGNGRSTFYRVEFSYESRPDHVEDYAQSARVYESGRLKWIYVKGAGQLIRKYRLDYGQSSVTGHSQLVTVQEYGSDGTSALPANTFTYEAGTNVFSRERWASAQGAWMSSNASGGTSQWFNGDFNGDGKLDLAKIWNGGYGAPAGEIAADVHVSRGGHFEVQRWANGQGAWISTNTGAGNSQWFTGDFNGDGKSDLAKIWNGGYGSPAGEIAADVHVSRGTQFEQQRWANGQGGWVSTDTKAGNSQWFTGDFNGDGKTDLAKIWNGGYGAPAGEITADVHVSRGAHFELQRWATGQGAWISTDVTAGNSQWFSGDFNGDGKTDLAKIWTNGYGVPAGTMGADVHISRGTHFEVQRWSADQGGWISTNASGGNSQWFAGDFNGDGKTDLAKIWRDGNVMSADVHLSRGTDFARVRWATGQGAWISTNTTAGESEWFAQDVDGDGRTDLLKAWSDGGAISVDLHRSRGDSFVLERLESQAGGWVPTNTVAGTATLMLGDFDGAGNDDLAVLYRASGDIYVDVHRSNRGQLARDLLTGITNPLGGATTVTYRPATLVANAVRPDITGPGVASASSLPLVTRVAVADGRGATYSTGYEYSNARYFPGVPADAENLGFEWTKEIDEQLNIVEVTHYGQEKPFHGRVRLSETRSPGGKLSQTEFSYAQIPSPHATRLIRKIREAQYHYEFGAFKYKTVTNYSFDTYGNATRVSNLNDTATDADDLHQFSSYINDTSAWRIGLVSEAHTCVGTASWPGEWWLSSTGGVNCVDILQHTRHYYDSLALGQVGVRGELTKTAAWRSDTDTWLETNQTYHASGNLLTRTDPAGIVALNNEYDPASGALIKVTNALKHTATHTYDPITGLLTAVTDANGNTSSVEYDVYGRKRRIESPHDGATRSVVEHSWGYHPNIDVTAVHTDRGQLVTTKHLDGLGRVWKTTQTWDNGSLLQTDAYFDAAGREYKTCAPHLATQLVDELSCTIQHYDAAGRVVRVDAPRSGGGTATTTTAYDGYRTTVTDPAGHVRVTDYDPATLTSTLTQPGGLTTLTTKDALGRVIRVTDPAGNVGTSHYNSLGWKLSQTDPARGDATFSYDALGQVVSQRDAAGQTTNLYYDKAGRLLRTDYAPLHASSAGTEDAVFKYDYLSSPGDIANARGRLVKVQDRSGSALLAYDVAGRVRTTTKTMDGAQYVATTKYGRTGKRLSLTYPDGSVVGYRYDTDAEHLTAITLDGVEVMRYGDYNERGSPTSLTYGNHIDEVSLTFESSTGELLQQRDSLDFVNNLYGYDERGMLVEERDQRTAKPNGNTSKAFAYDALGQLAAAAMGSNAGCSGVSCAGDAWSKNYVYDSVGRVLEKDARAFTYDAGKPFQLMRVAGEAADRTYDPVGRLLSKTTATGVTDTYVNGADGFLSEHRRDGATLQRMTYDYLGNRVKQEILGAKAQTTWDLGNYKIVRDHASGKYFHTLYVLGLHGSRIAHRTTEKAGTTAAGVWGGYQDRALASLYEPSNISGVLPWAKHQGPAIFKALLTDIDGARGITAALAGLAMLSCILFLLGVSVWQLLSTVHGKLKSVPRVQRRAAWVAPAMLVVMTTACVGKYDQPTVGTDATAATAESIDQSGRYSIMQAIKRDGTNQPVPGTFYYLNSPLGSTSVMFDTQGAALLRLEYFPDGTVNTAASTGNYIATHTFGQKEYDKELELYYNAFRYYDADTMRFTTPDAIKESSDFLVHNIYAYTRNNPVNYTDPTGFITAMRPDGVRRFKPAPRPAPRPAVRALAPKRTGSWANGPDGVRRVSKPAARPAARANPPAARESTRTGAWANGPDGVSVRKYDGNHPAPGGPQYKTKFPHGMTAMVPDGIRDAQAPEKYKHNGKQTGLSQIHDSLVTLYYNHNQTMTISYHGYDRRDPVVQELQSWPGVHDDRDYWDSDGTYAGNMDRYRAKGNIVYSSREGGIWRESYFGHNQLSMQLNEALVAGDNYPIGEGAWGTHVSIDAYGGRSKCLASLMCVGPTQNVNAMRPDRTSFSTDTHPKIHDGRLGGGYGGVSGGMLKYR